ncbi:uncharacterized protein TNCV_978151 [Trichonephila clavipes]|nr:uncharacterized protein TNCV_978151 [Trichonephila clavipes]
MLCDARELDDKIDIPANFELTQPRHIVRRRNVNFDYEARDDPTEDPTLNFKDIAYSPNKCGSFSKLKLIKEFLRSTTTEDRLNGLTTIDIEHELAEEINVKEIIKKNLRIKMGDWLTNTFTKYFCVRIANTFKVEFLCSDNEHIFGGDQEDTPEIMDGILTTARDLELEVNEDDIEKLIMEHEDELTIRRTPRNFE